jgi:hypothetical protein
VIARPSIDHNFWQMMAYDLCDEHIAALEDWLEGEGSGKGDA